MKNRFNLTEEEKNRIRGLHLTESKDKRITSTINESPEFLYEDMDASNVDLGNAAETEEEDWLKEDWDDLSEDIQNSFKEHKEFKNMDNAAIREKYNAMPLTALCKISRFLLGWIVKLFRAPVTAFTKGLRKNSPMVGPNYGRRRAWPCKKRYKRW